MKSVITTLLLLLHSASYSQSVKVSWNANQESDLAGYKVYIGESSRNYGGNVDVKKETTFVWSSLELGKTYYFAVTAYDYTGNESEYSDEVSAILSDTPDTIPPDPPSNIRIEIIEEDFGKLDNVAYPDSTLSEKEFGSLWTPIRPDTTLIKLPQFIWAIDDEATQPYFYYDEHCDCIRMLQQHSDATEN